MNTIGDRIKFVRKEHNATQQRFADELGLKQNTIATYEMNRTAPSERTLSDICEKFGVDPVWLRTGEGEPFVPVSREDRITDILSKAISGNSTARDRLIRALARLPDEMFEPAEKILEEIVANLQNEKE